MMLGDVIRAWRKQCKLGLREAEKITGVSYVTIHRLEKGRNIYHQEMARLLVWLLTPPPRTP